jgi:hypothetical protein
LLVYFGLNTIGAFQSFFEGSYTILHLFTGLLYLREGQLVVLLSFFVFKLKVASLATLLDCLVYLPIVHSLLKPLLHEPGIPGDLVDLCGPHLLQSFLPRVQLISITCLGDSVLTDLLIFELL